MTREEITKSLKPLAWDIWEGGKYRFANPTEAHEAMIMIKDDGRLLVKINRYGRMESEAETVAYTMQDAMDYVREWQVSRICSYFKMND